MDIMIAMGASVPVSCADVQKKKLTWLDKY